MSDAAPAERARIGAILAQLAEGWEDLDGFSFEKNGKTYTVPPAAFAMACEALRIRLEAPDEPDDTTAIIRELQRTTADASPATKRAISAAVAHLHRMSAEGTMMLAMVTAAAAQTRSE